MDPQYTAPFLRATSIAPIFVAVDLEAALERYRKLGFTTRDYRDTPDSPPVYGFVCFGPGEFHIARVDHGDPNSTTAACYLYVEDADAVYAAWSMAEVDGRLHPPQDTPYGLRELTYVDPDGNLIRVGSPMDPESTQR
jgi:catechol 2,3-dioxygenase-like lactoylglutathione lyase family enzyme